MTPEEDGVLAAKRATGFGRWVKRLEAIETAARELVEALTPKYWHSPIEGESLWACLVCDAEVEAANIDQLEHTPDCPLEALRALLKVTS